MKCKKNGDMGNSKFFDKEGIKILQNSQVEKPCKAKAVFTIDVYY